MKLIMMKIKKEQKNQDKKDDQGDIDKLDHKADDEREKKQKGPNEWDRD